MSSTDHCAFNDGAPPTHLQPEKLSELGQLLSIKTIVSTTPSNASFEKIGAGTCGTIFALSGAPIASKIAKHKTDALTGDLFNDYRMHIAVLRAMQSIGHSDGVVFARVPRFFAWAPSSDEDWWAENAAFASAATEKGIEVPSNVLCTERIMHLPLPVRSALIERFCPEGSKVRAHQDVSNKDCLVRVYLGAYKEIRARDMFFSLRNYKMHLDQMLQLGMDVQSYCDTMAATLACLHWKAKIDACDIEFVLGSSPENDFAETSNIIDEITDPDTYVGPKSKTISLHWNRRRTNLWVLDFNMCQKITMDDVGVAMAVQAWRTNDPYYPKPCQDKLEDRMLWNRFASRYIEVSDQILQSEPALVQLPRKFLAGIRDVQAGREAAKRARAEGSQGSPGP